MPGVSIDWDEEAGEDWARLLKGDSVLVALRSDAPIAFVCGTDDISKRLSDDLVGDGWEVIRSTGWDEPEFSLDGPTATALFPHWFFAAVPPQNGSWDPHNFSASDFWWATS